MEEKEYNYVPRHGDRRKNPTAFFSEYTFCGRRCAMRRADEQYNYYVDRLGGRAWVVIAVVIISSIIDSLFTIYFLNKGFLEVNPIMNVAVFVSKPFFIVFKYTITIIGILIIAIHKNFRYVKILMAVIIAMYTILNMYHVYLLW